MPFQNLISYFLFVLFISYTYASVRGYIGTSDTKKLLQTLEKSLTTDNEDLSSIYFGTVGYKILKQPFPSTTVENSCKLLKKYYKEDGTAEQTFYALSAWYTLGCAGKLHTERVLKTLRILVESEKSSALDIRYSAEALKLLAQAIPSPAKVAQTLQARLKEDDSLTNLGYALHTASLLGNSGKFAVDKVEDIISQLDEVNGKILQWEGGLTVTSLLITGLVKLPGAKPLTQEHSDKLANYLLTRRTVQNSKGVVALLEAADALSFCSVPPVSISIIGQSYVTSDKPDLKVRISDLLGRPLKPIPAPVVAQSATRITDDVVVLSKQPFAAGSGPTEFTLPLRLEPGQYHIALSAGSHSATLNVRVLGQVNVKSFEIGLSDIDGSAAPQLTKLQYPGKLSTNLQADSSHQLVAKFSLTKPVHQTFLRLHSGKKEIIFIAELDSSKVYKVEVNLVSELAYSGSFDVELILGDPVMSNPIRWTIGKLEANLGKSEPEIKVARGAKPEIRHLFRQAEKRPAESVSLLFTFLTAAPLLLLVILWLKIGINFSNFSLVSLPFHVGFGMILGLFVCFWLKLDMFQTCAWLIPLGGFTFLTGHKALSHSANRGKKAEKKD